MISLAFTRANKRSGRAISAASVYEILSWSISRTLTLTSLFRPIQISSSGTFQDGGLKHNNPINLALWESRYIWPEIEKPDVVISLGTGTGSRTSSTPAPNFRHVIHDGFIPRLWRCFMSSLDGQGAWRDL